LKFPVADGDIIYQYDNATGFKVTMFDFGVWGAGRPEDEPYVRVGEAFWSRKLAPTQWVRSFRVSPF
jgi:hypothetical protein